MGAVIRLLGFFLLVLCVLQVLRFVPVVGAILQIPFLGFWLTAILVSAAMSKLAAEALDRRKRSALMRQLGTVDTPHNKGKLGLLLLQQKRYKQALPLLEEAAAADPEGAEWPYRIGTALLGMGEAQAARERLEVAIARNEEHAYGAARMRLAEALMQLGEHEAAYRSLERFELNHGPNPESAYRRGLALRASGQREAARAAFDEVGQLANQLAKFGRKGATGWVLRASLLKWV